MLSEHQRIEASPSPAAENTMPPPPSYEEVNHDFTSETHDDLTDIRDYFLGEVLILVWLMPSFSLLHCIISTNCSFLTATGYVHISRCNWCGVKFVFRGLCCCPEGTAIVIPHIFDFFFPFPSFILKLNSHVLEQVSNNGWAEGECKGKAGWFPVNYIERRERVQASKVAAVF